MEHGLHIPERHQGGLVPHGGRLVADHEGNGQADVLARAGLAPRRHPPADHLVHPGARPLLRGAGVRVEIKVGGGHAPPGQLEEADVRVPDGRGLGRGHGHDVHVKQALDEGEQAVQDVGQGKVGAQGLVGQVAGGGEGVEWTREESEDGREAVGGARTRSAPTTTLSSLPPLSLSKNQTTHYFSSRTRSA